MGKAIHIPVLLREVGELLKVKPEGKYIDATVGEGGHAQEIIRRGGRVLGIDRDPVILEMARRRLGSRAVLVQGNFREIGTIAEEQGFTKADGVLMDLGISSWQLEESGRGFSFQRDEPLDMRLDPELTVTAADLLNGLNRDELEKLFQKYGEEKRASQLAAAVVRARSLRPFRTTLDLVKVIEKAVRKRGRIPARHRDAPRPPRLARLADRQAWRARHPATKVFQALRIAVNDEIENLRSALPRAFEVLGAGGRMAVISFHSLEDREVKRFFRELEEGGRGTALTDKPIRPTAAEIAENPRSRSARMRGMKRK